MGAMMTELSELSQTLYVPLAGRIYASTQHPSVFYDEKALELEAVLPSGIERIRRGQSDYTMLASVSRSINMDRRIRAYLFVHPDAAIVNVGCGLETAFWRCDNGRALWFELDLPEVIDVRNRLLPAGERHVSLPGDMFDYSWIDHVRSHGERPTLIIVSGVFYYFHEDLVIDFINHLAAFGAARVVFDSTSSIGVKVSQYYVRRMKNSSVMRFSIDDVHRFVSKLGGGARLVEHTPYYRGIDRRGLGLLTRASMRISDAFRMVAMTCIDLAG